MADVFISYKREERDKAKALAEAIVKRGYSVWWDVDLLPGDRFAKEIDAVIAKAKAAIVLWSKAAIESDWVIAEATEAKKRRIFIPARLDDVEPPLYFRADQTHDLSGWDGDGASDRIAPILAAVERRVGPPTEKAAAAPAAVAEALSAPNMEAEFWRTVSAAPVQTVTEYEAYLRKFGERGLFADVAKMRIEQLKALAPRDKASKRIEVARNAVAVVASVFAIVGVVHQITKSSSDGDGAPKKSDKAMVRALEDITADRLSKDDGVMLAELALQKTSLEKLEAAAEDDAVAATLAGLVYANGLGGEAVNDVRSTKLYRLGCDGGAGRACFNLASNIANGRGATPDEEKVAIALERGCRLGDPDSCTDLGYYYEQGKGVPQSDVKATDFYRQACEAGAALGCNNLGHRYQTGKSAPKDEAEAARLYRLACDNGSGLGCSNLGFLHDKGIGVSQNDAEAVKYYRLGCDKYEPIACGNLGFMVLNGRGTQQNDVEAAGHFKRGCEGGNAFSCAHYATALDNAKGVANDPQTALRYYLIGCEGGEMFACTNLGFMYQGDRGVPANYAEALRLYQKACDGGESYGCNNLGHMYMTGRGVDADLTRAIALFERSIRLDETNTYAKDNLALAREGA